MKTLIVYDNNGKIFNQMSGDYTPPDGIDFIEVVLPSDKMLVGVDVENKTPILEDIPKSEMELIKQQIKDTEEAINFLLMGGF